MFALVLGTLGGNRSPSEMYAMKSHCCSLLSSSVTNSWNGSMSESETLPSSYGDVRNL